MIDTILAALDATGVTAWRSSDADPSRADTVPGLVTLVDPVVGGKLWPVHLPNDAPDTTGVYNLAGQGDIEVDGYRLSRVDTYVLSLRSPEFDPLRTMSDDLIARVAAHAGLESWEITDAATDYEFDPRQYRAHFELQATSLATAAPALPAAFVHPLASDAGANRLATMEVRQTITEEVAVVLVAGQADLEGQRAAVTAALLGLEETDSVSPLVYAGGERIAVSGRLVFWRERYRYERLIRST
ncbi:phage tail terminator protein [Halomonas elongata]|uniref:phage tail terminator protein n=1 Tax=Halomonas elongata TaxID=2746 RepID=UPI00186BB241|nr:hypothetical protein [Halomonas elongata]MBW5802045.1 hypothetical protein [Halomonas elongata]